MGTASIAIAGHRKRIGQRPVGLRVIERQPATHRPHEVPFVQHRMTSRIAVHDAATRIDQKQAGADAVRFRPEMPLPPC